MPESGEVDVDKVREAIDEELEREGGSLLRVIALTTALLAAIAAVASLLAGSTVNEALVLKSEATRLQAQASDQRAYYQAKGIKAAIASGAASAFNAARRAAPDSDVYALPARNEIDRELAELCANDSLLNEIGGATPLEINGRLHPDTLVMHVGRPARLWLINLSTFHSSAAPLIRLVHLADSAVRLSASGVRWRRLVPICRRTRARRGPPARSSVWARSRTSSTPPRAAMRCVLRYCPRRSHHAAAARCCSRCQFEWNDSREGLMSRFIIAAGRACRHAATVADDEVPGTDGAETTVPASGISRCVTDRSAAELLPALRRAHEFRRRCARG